MSIRNLVAALAIVLLPASLFADDHPYKNVKVGDFATFTTDIKVGTFALKGTTTVTVTAKSEKEATIKSVATVNGMTTPPQVQKIDLTKPYDPASLNGLPPGTDAKIEKGKEGKEKLTLLGKEYDCDWSTYKIKATVMGQAFDGDIKVWLSSKIPMGMGKMEMNTSVAGMKMELKMELSETGNKK
jgi:hypothetical protein